MEDDNGSGDDRGGSDNDGAGLCDDSNDGDGGDVMDMVTWIFHLACRTRQRRVPFRGGLRHSLSLSLSLAAASL